MLDWRDLGLGRGFAGREFTVNSLVCLYCGGQGRFCRVFRGHVRHPETNADLYSDVWQCLECTHFVFVVWREEQGFVDYRAFPYEKHQSVARPSWPIKAGTPYLMGVNALLTEDYESAVVMARRAIGTAAAGRLAEPGELLEMLTALAKLQLIPRPLLEWAERMPQLRAMEQQWGHEDAREILRLTRYLLDTLYTLPHDVKAYSRNPGSDSLRATTK